MAASSCRARPGDPAESAPGPPRGRRRRWPTAPGRRIPAFRRRSASCRDARLLGQLALDPPLLAVEVEIFDGDPLGALDLVVDPGDRQAAFFADLLTAAFLQGRINEG